MKSNHVRKLLNLLGHVLVPITFSFFAFTATAESCPDFSGKYAGKDSVGSYTIEYSQTACTSLTQSIAYEHGKSFRPVKLDLAHPQNDGCFDDRSCLRTAYWFTESDFQSFRISRDEDQTVRNVTYTTMSKTENGDLRIVRINIDADGKNTSETDIGTRIDREPSRPSAVTAGN